MRIGDIEDEEVRTKAIEYAISDNGKEYRESSGLRDKGNHFDYRVDRAFAWDRTEEGYRYWSLVYQGVDMSDEPGSHVRCRPSCPEEPAEKEDQVNPKHYKENLFGKELQYVMIETFGEEKYKAFCQLNAFKYRMRAGNKADKAEQDIQKAMWYEEKLKSL